ncbi:MAG: NAD(P)-binding protein [Hyphomonadaceae bacterium]|nr:NAD(P)-binding protein [Hyphomonadaceae bacterium]
MGDRTHILISGGGIGGLTAAIALAQRGAKVDVFEKAPKFEEIGAGIQLGPNAMHVLSALGLEKNLKKLGFEPAAATLRDYKSGKPELRTRLKSVFKDRYRQIYLNIHRADLHLILQEAALKEGVKIHMDAPVNSYWQSVDHVMIEAGENAFNGDFLIGADGIHSKIRETMQGEHKLKFTGHVAWRGTVPTHRLPRKLIPPEANVWLGPGRHFVAYYVNGGDKVNFVAVEERDSWAEAGWNIKGNVGDVRAAFTGWDERIGRLLRECKECYLWGLFDREPLETWSSGRVTLLGDACHPMLPFMAQGAAMAIEDSYVLAKHLMDRDRGFETALERYEEDRKPRTTMMQKISRENGELYHRKPLGDRIQRKMMFKAASIVTLAAYGKLDRVYGVNVTKD